MEEYFLERKVYHVIPIACGWIIVTATATCDLRHGDRTMPNWYKEYFPEREVYQGSSRSQRQPEIHHGAP
jgi:hypothetical protein